MTQENSKSRSPNGQGEPTWLTVEQLAEHLQQPLDLVLRALKEGGWTDSSAPWPGLTQQSVGKDGRSSLQYAPFLIELLAPTLEIISDREPDAPRSEGG